MTCPGPQQENGLKAKFCQECATPLARNCAKCGNELPSTAKFCPECAHPTVDAVATDQARIGSPETYTPKHLAEKILTSRSALEGERKQVTVLFADLKGSMELLADRDPEEARKLLDPVVERMMEAVHCYEGTVNQVMGDGIMALFGAPLAHEDHAVRACYAALRMQDLVRRYAEEARHVHGVNVQIRVGLISQRQRATVVPLGLWRGMLRSHRVQNSFAPVLLVTAGDPQCTAGRMGGLFAPSLELRRLSQDEQAQGQEGVAILADGLDAFLQKCDGFSGAVREQVGVAEGANRGRCHPGHARFHSHVNCALQRADGMRPLVAQEHLATATTMYHEMDMRF